MARSSATRSIDETLEHGRCSKRRTAYLPAHAVRYLREIRIPDHIAFNEHGTLLQHRNVPADKLQTGKGGMRS
jgi:hypothetical protein